jgi:hypothetical protein
VVALRGGSNGLHAGDNVDDAVAAICNRWA